ncbi:MAG: C4-dicarboxylate ABC transporter substrate-binding protein [Gammaproteobacteria bacterium]|nr:MAG: C4-dicarboxylate ABC transporter substrate-binding protein [Gammaproteobacteria bacterium]
MLKTRLLAILFATILLPSLAVAENYRFVSGPQGGNWFVLGGAISSYFSEAGMNTSSSTGGGVSNVVSVNRKKADLGFSVGSLLGAATKGEGKFKKPVENVVVLANLYPQVTYFIARKDFVEKHQIKTLGDALAVKELRIASLKPGSSSEFVISALFKMGYGKDWKSIKKDGGEVQFASYSDGAGLIADNHIDMFAFSVGEVASVIMNIESQTDVVILPVKQDILDKFGEAYGTGTHTIKPGIYKSVTTEIPTVGDYTICVVRKDLSDETVTKMAATLLANKKNLTATIKDFGAFNPRSAVAKKLPMHPAAKAFFEAKQK